MMKLIVLEGKDKVGKTTTINITYQLLLQRGYRQVPGHFRPFSKGDFIDVLTDGIKKIGFLSQGNYAITQRSRRQYSVRDQLKYLQSRACDKVVCACSVGRRKDKIKRFIAEYEHTVIQKEGIEDQALKRILDNRHANQILLLI